MLLSGIRHRQQTQADCLVICAATVLAYLGITWSEDYLVRVLGTTEDGTPFFHIERLQALGVVVTAGKHGDWRVFAYALALGLPVIAGVTTWGWRHWNGEVAQHAVVVVGLDQEHGLIYINDPFFAEAPIEMTLDEFALGWEEKDRQYAILSLAPL